MLNTSVSRGRAWFCSEVEVFLQMRLSDGSLLHEAAVSEAV